MTERRPIIIIPGIFGSRLVNQHNEIIWPCSSKYTAFKIPSNMLRLWGRTTADGLFENFSDDIITAIPGLSGCESLIPNLEEFKCFYDISTSLQAQGYRENIDLFAFTYDFRHSLLRLSEQFETFTANLKLKSLPILITHSIGSLIPRFLQHKSANWSKIFASQIAIAGTFDGANGGGLMAVVDGYDLQFSWLRHCTRGFWCNSGMQLGLLQSKNINSGVQQYVYLKIQETSSEKTQDLNIVQQFWENCRIIKWSEKSTIMGIFKLVLENPKAVNKNAGFWAMRFKKLLGRKVYIPDTAFEENECYESLSCCFNQEKKFFANQQYPLKEQISDVQQVIDLDSKYVRYAFWAQREEFVPTQQEIEYFQTRKLEDAPQDNIQRLVYTKYWLDTNNKLPQHTETRDLRDLYHNISEEGTLEALVFPQNDIQHEAHQNLRDQEIDFQSFKFASICGSGIQTSSHAIFNAEIQNEYELHGLKHQCLYSEGDGTVLLSSQISDSVPDSHVIERKIFSGIGHVDLMKNQACVAKILEYVKLMQ
ncbi:Lecithin-cholesterol acyltransferase [Spironucleus salmonicida]|uniref:Lecithin-cholesterol acyltransferase n=1 Tax=Spironucleus salmonicida TaxID=348837 RepID=V6LL74_9EUKA|nr:Lecithin-cholesterol acyltransferase [Spironucleus salmonicida]|eukprot:EST44491.1 Lecithin-cholesterol acyltransferase [Spironucleus salmonicida]